MGFEVGKKCISKVSTPIYKRGTVKELMSIRKCICSCDSLILDFGFKYDSPSTNLECAICGTIVPDVSNTLWVYAKHWDPLDEISTELSETTVNDILKPEKQPC